MEVLIMMMGGKMDESIVEVRDLVQIDQGPPFVIEVECYDLQLFQLNL
jgi:hypothetical protein